MIPDSKFARFTYAENRPCFQVEKPYHILSHIDSGLTGTNLTWESPALESVANIRGRENDFSLDQHGFCFKTLPTTFSDWDNAEKVETICLDEVKNIIKQNIEGADEVEIFDWRRRSKDWRARPGEAQDMNNPTHALRPAEQVHLDQSPYAVLKRVRKLMGDRADYLLRGRVQVINVWRPLHIVSDWPLVLSDGRSISHQDLLEVDLIRTDYVGETMYAMYRPGYTWYYLDGQKPDEVCFFKNFDSSEEAEATICPHVSLPPDGIGENRESVEFRVFVFTHPE